MCLGRLWRLCRSCSTVRLTNIRLDHFWFVFRWHTPPYNAPSTPTMSARAAKLFSNHACILDNLQIVIVLLMQLPAYRRPIWEVPFWGIFSIALPLWWCTAVLPQTPYSRFSRSPGIPPHRPHGDSWRVPPNVWAFRASSNLQKKVSAFSRVACYVLSTTSVINARQALYPDS